MVDSVADARASVLITGENGTGKSMVRELYMLEVLEVVDHSLKLLARPS